MEALSGQIGGNIEGNFLFFVWGGGYVFSLYGLWEAGNVRKTLQNISGYRELHSENLSFFTFSADFRPSQLDVHSTNSGIKNGHVVAPGMSLAHPERCATKVCARK